MRRILILLFIVAVCGCTSFNRHTVENTVEEINYHYPTFVDNGVVATKATVEGDCVVFHYCVNEDERSIDEFRNIDNKARLQDLESHGPEMKEFISLIKRSNMTMKEIYVGSNTGNKVEISLVL